MPRHTLPTRAVWYTIGLDTLLAAGLSEAAVPGALHAAEHAAIGLLPLVRRVRPFGHRRAVDRAAPGHRRTDRDRL